MLDGQTANLGKTEGSGMTDWPKPTAQVEPYVDALGPEKAVEFLLEFGGAKMTFPRSPGSSSELVQFLGMPDATALCAQMNFAPTDVPNAKLWLVHALTAKGLSKERIARKLHVSRVWVRGSLKRLPTGAPRPPEPLPLFPKL